MKREIAKSEMTKRERLVTTLAGGQADRVPVCPDISIMIPCKLTGKKFPEVLLRANPPLWKAYLDAMDYYDFEGLFQFAHLPFRELGPRSTVKCTESRDAQGRIMMINEWETPDGNLRERIVYPDYDAETRVEKLVKDFKEDFPKFLHTYRAVDGIKTEEYYREQCKLVGDKGAIGAGVMPPGMMSLIYYFEGNMEALVYAYYDEPELFEELIDIWGERTLQRVDALLSVTPKLDFIIGAGSGSITLQSPELFDKFTLPFMKKFTKMCKDAGVVSGWHSCGLEKHLIKRAAEETDLNFVNPLEIPPMGDCDLKELKQLYGDKLCLMGNLHTTEVMLFGSPELVRKKALEALLDAGEGGGFVLGTGDQPGWGTPEENMRALIQVGREFGQYPLDRDRIREEIARL